MPEIQAGRRERARQKIAETGADAALITSGPNVRYLTGLASSNAALLLLASGPAVLATDSRYALAAERDCPGLELIIERFIEPRLAAEMTRRSLRTVEQRIKPMQVDVRQHRRDHPTLRCPLIRPAQFIRAVRPRSRLCYTSLQPHANQFQYFAIHHPYAHACHQPFVRNRIEITFQVRVIHHLIPGLKVTTYLFQRLMC